MLNSAFDEFTVLFGAAAGLMGLGMSALVSGGCCRGARMAARAASVALAALVPSAAGNASGAVVVATLIGVVAVGSLIADSRWALGILCAALRWAARRGVHAAALSVGGGMVLVAAVARFDAADQGELDRTEAEMAEVTWRPTLRPAGRAATDAGRTVTLYAPESERGPIAMAAAEQRTLDGRFAERLLRVGPPADQADCHGWVFAGGQYWVASDDVESILADNGYQPATDPRPGDLVVYRVAGRVAHTAVVAATGGERVLVEGKWGCLGVYLHAPQDSVYGPAFAYYRSRRVGHLLAGLHASTGEIPVRNDDMPSSTEEGKLPTP